LLSRLQSDAGSAVSDFVLLVVPASLLAIPLLELFGLYQSAIVKEQLSYGISRYAALADVTSIEAELYKQNIDTASTLKRESSALSCIYVTKTDLERRITFWPELITVSIQGSANCENR
jgi:hypothetical protein